MIVDTSALVAIVFDEPEAADLAAAIARSDNTAIGTPTLVEVSLVLAARLRSDPQALILRLLDGFGIKEIAFVAAHWRAASDAFLAYGRGRHPAHLNFGDCMTYAIAQIANEPLLFVGNDFAATDVEPAR